MRYIKSFNEGIDTDELNTDIRGLLVELGDENTNINYTINDSYCDGKRIKTVSFSTNRGTHWNFDIKVIRSYLATIEDYLKAKGCSFSYDCEYFDFDEDQNYYEDYTNVSKLYRASAMKKIHIMNLDLNIKF